MKHLHRKAYISLRLELVERSAHFK